VTRVTGDRYLFDGAMKHVEADVKDDVGVEGDRKEDLLCRDVNPS
jgi:hypothetical protein